MKSLEKKYKCLVYAITHEFTEFGECYSFLIVTDYKSEWKTLMYSEGNTHTAFAYVWNKDDDWCSEFGSVTVQSFGGGRRYPQDRVRRNMKVYLVKLDWSTEDSNDIELFVCSTYEKA